MPWLIKGGEEVVIEDANLAKECLPAGEVASALFLCATCRCIFTGSFSSKEKTQDTISAGSGTILKLSGS